MRKIETLFIVGLACTFVVACEASVIEDDEMGEDTPTPDPDPRPPAPRMIDTFADSEYLSSAECDTGTPQGPAGDTVPVGTITKPIATFMTKPTCSESALMVVTICLKEIENGVEYYSIDLNNNLICATWKHVLNCESPDFVLGDSECVDGPGAYCDFTVPPMDPLACGWRIDNLKITNLDNETEITEQFTPDLIDTILFDPPIFAEPLFAE